MNLAVIIPAAGASRRYIDLQDPDFVARGGSKLDEDLGGRPVLQRTVELFTKHPDVTFIVVAGPADPGAMSAFKLRHADKLGLLGVRICEGGKEHRYQTVANALKLIPESCTHVAVHDAARPCTSTELIENILRAAERHPAVIPAVDVPDTLKRVKPEAVVDEAPDPLAAILGPDTGGPKKSANRLVEKTLDRAHVVAVQTPQVFRLDLLRRAYAQADLTSTDDAQLVERLGEPVLVVPGEPTNIKITRPSDLRMARAVLGVRGPDSRPTHMKF
jgi:2-C-methyl-D-erythritol 4-phosphate cytidylyltransferase